MRLEAGSPQWKKLIDEWRRIDVYLNDAPQEMVEIADEEQGYLVQAVTDENGLIEVDRSSNQIKRRTLYGIVRIKISEPRPEDQLSEKQ